MDELNSNYQQVYNVREDEALLSQVETVLCVLAPRALYIAGFDGNKELLTIHYSGYSNAKPVWDLDFFEHSFAQELFLRNKDKVKSAFISSKKSMVVPEELFEEEAAKIWLSHIHFIEKTDTTLTFPLGDEKAHYVYAFPVNIAELIRINFKKAPALPLPFYHFCETGKQSLYMQCVLSKDQVTATLHNYSQLLWHQTFSYTCAEDIAYEIKHLCMENNISPSKVSIACNTLSAAEYNVLNDLTQYYPAIKCGDKSSVNSRWAPAISLAKQLLSCV